MSANSSHPTPGARIELKKPPDNSNCQLSSQLQSLILLQKAPDFTEKRAIPIIHSSPNLWNTELKRKEIRNFMPPSLFFLRTAWLFQILQGLPLLC